MKMLLLVMLGFLLACATIGCTESPPDHSKNWFYYWKEGVVIDDMDQAEYLWSTEFADTRGLSAPGKTETVIGIGDAAVAARTASLVVNNKYDPAAKTVAVEVAGAKGIDSVAITIAHEFEHIWIHHSWGANLGQTGTVNGHTHSDTDAIPDDVENDRTAGSIGGIYRFSSVDADSYGMTTYYGGIYSSYGDNEILAREEGFNNPRSTHADKDWSKGGKQWQY